MMQKSELEFQKTAKQIQATKLAGTSAMHIMLTGGSRSGKTFDHIRRIFIRASKTKSRHVIFRLKFNSVKKAVWLDTIPKVLSMCFPDICAIPNKSDFYYTLPNESEVWIGGLDDKERTEKILGMEFSTLYFNECSQIPYTSVLMAMTRLAEKNSLAKKVYYDQNPPGKKHWAYWLWERGFDPMSEEAVDKSQYVSLLMNPIDNVDNIAEEYLAILEKMPEKERNRFLLGLYADEDDGVAYYKFDRDKHVKTLSRMPGTIWCGMDFNVDPMTCVIFQMVNNEFHVLDEIYLRNSDTYRMCHELQKRYKGAIVIPDSTGKNRKTSGKSDFVILQDAGFRIEPTRNPFVTDRVNNINRLFEQGKIFINPKCKKLINDLEKVSWKDNKLDQKTDKMLTHMSDCLGYGTWKLMPLENIKGITITRR